MTATTTQDHITQAARTGQEAMSTALRGWGETMQTVMGMGAGRGDLPSPDRLIDTWFDVADETLTAQREFAKAMLAFGGPVIDAMGRAALHTIETTQEATRAATREATEATREATEATGEATQEATREATQESPRATRSSGARKDG